MIRLNLLQKAVAILLLCGLSAGCAWLSRGSAPKTPIAPDFSLPSLDGGRFSLESTNGKVVLIHFWSTWCTSCISELESLHNLYRYVNSENFEIVTIAIDDTWESVNKLRIKNGYTFPMLVDREGMARNKYSVSGIPVTFLLSAKHEFLQFREPESGNTVNNTTVPQRWDLKESAEYFRELVENK